MSKKQTKTISASSSNLDDFTVDLIKSLNSESGERIAYNLACDESPTHVKRWISTGCLQLDYILGNRRNGGIPEGRIIEIYGMPSTGKSHIAYELCKSVQNAGGIVVYLDTENATNVDKLADMGINVAKRFVFCEPSYTEEVFSVMENTISKVRAMNKDVPVIIVWDSLAATPPKAELEGDYEANTIGLQARVMSKGLRKITQLIGDLNVVVVVLNQMRMKIGVMFGNPETTSGGNALPFHASQRVKLSLITQVKDDEGDVVGVSIRASTEKNKLAPPHRKCEFSIIFGKGIIEDEFLFERLKDQIRVIDGKKMSVGGNAKWKLFNVINEETNEVIIEKKFMKTKTSELFDDNDVGKYFWQYVDAVMIKQTSGFEDLAEDEKIDESE